MRLFILLFFVLVYTSSSALTMQVGNADGTEYLIFVPPSYDGSEAYPLLVYLHGAQAIGDTISCSVGKGLPGAIKNNNFFNNIPMIIVAPHAKKNTGCSDINNNDYEWDVAMVNKVIEHIIDSLNIDQSRIFGSGISLGAKGMWDYVLAYPDRMAGIVPFSGNAPIENICLLDEVAVWAFHGEVDGIIPPTGGTDRKGSQTVVDELNSCDDKPYIPAYITILQSKTHNGWDQVYDLSSGYNIYEWLLALKKNVSTDYTPLVNIGPDKSFVTPPHQLTIKSFAYDPNGTIEYNWNISGPIQTTLSGQPNITADFSSPGTYNIELTVTDNEGNVNSDQTQYTVLNNTGTTPAITQLRLYNGNTDLGPISNNQVVNLDNYDATLLDVVAVTENLNSRASVRFSLNSDHNFISLNEDKINTNYSIGNNNHKQYIPTEGKHTITATAYGDRNTLTANQGISYEVTLIYSNGPLPIKLLEFTASSNNGNVILNWTTTEEIDNSHFEIYQGLGQAKSMKKIAKITKSPSNKSIKHYSYTVEDVPCGNLYYQLRSIDLDGQEDHSRIISTRNTMADCKARVYPNPVIKNSFIYEHKNNSEITTLTLLNSAGIILKSYELSPSEGDRITIETNDLTPGTYFIRTNSNNYIETQKLIISPKN